MIIIDFIDRYEFLSNSHWVNLEMDGDTYPSVDHAYQAAKTNDPHKRARIRAASSSHIARQMGHAMPRPRDWEARRLDIMRDLLADKFSYPDLAQSLLETREHVLINSSWDRRDQFWGTYRDKGENWLGRLLMELRTSLRSTPVPATAASASSAPSVDSSKLATVRERVRRSKGR